MFKRLLPLLLAIGGLPAGATTTYTSFATMTAANPALNFTNVDFSGLSTYSPAASFSASGVDFTALSGTLSGNANLSGWASGMILKTTANGGTILITLPSTATAFGGYFGFVGTGTWSVVLSGAGDTSFSQTASVTQLTPTYWGVVSATPFTSISVTLDGSTKLTAVNGFSFGTPTGGGGGGGAETPEPSTLALMGSALLALPLMARRMRLVDRLAEVRSAQG